MSRGIDVREAYLKRHYLGNTTEQRKRAKDEGLNEFAPQYAEASKDDVDRVATESVDICDLGIRNHLEKDAHLSIREVEEEKERFAEGSVVEVSLSELPKDFNYLNKDALKGKSKDAKIKIKIMVASYGEEEKGYATILS